MRCYGNGFQLWPHETEVRVEVRDGSSRFRHAPTWASHLPYARLQAFELRTRRPGPRNDCLRGIVPSLARAESSGSDDGTASRKRGSHLAGHLGLTLLLNDQAINLTPSLLESSLHLIPGLQ